MFVNRFRALEEASLEKREAFARSVDTAVRGRITVRQLQLGHTVSARMAAAAGDVCEAGRRVVRLQLCRKLTLELLTTICTSLVTPVACILAAYGKIELASTVMIAQICRFIVLQTNGLGTAVQQLGVHLVFLPDASGRCWRCRMNTTSRPRPTHRRRTAARPPSRSAASGWLTTAAPSSAARRGKSAAARSRRFWGRAAAARRVWSTRCSD